MPTRKRTKDSRMRGHHTHGWGEKKKRRGSGSRGGKGNAGSGKRSDTKKPSMWKYGRFHKIGFISRSTTKHNPINVGDIELMIEHRKFEKKGTAYDINLTALGYTKLLSKGTIKYPITITVSSATERAVKKISAAGGTVTADKTE